MDDLRDILTTWAVAGLVIAAIATLPADKEPDEGAGLYDPSIRAQMHRDQALSEIGTLMDDADARIGMTLSELDHAQWSEVVVRRSRLIQYVLSLNINCGPALAPGG